MNDTAQAPELQRPPEVGTSASHWFFRGLAGGVMLIAAVNAISYFFLSEGYTDLVGVAPRVDEAIGFPFAVWDETNPAGPNIIDSWGSAMNMLIGMGLGCVFGFIGVALRPQFNQWVVDFEQENQESKSLGTQFTLQSALFWTSVTALFVALLTRWNGSSFGLGAIYLLGPATLIGIAMFPSDMHWRLRAVIVAVLSIALIAVAIRSGLRLKMPIDRVMLGFFVCWTPQTVFAAFGIVVAFVIRAIQLQMEEKPVEA